MHEDERRSDEGVDLGRPVELTTVSGDMQANLLRSRLEDAGIPTALVDRKAGGALKATMGFSNAPVRVLVPESLLDTAREILSSPPDDAEEEAPPPDEPEEDAAGAFMRRRSFVAKVVAAVVVGNAILAALFLAVWIIGRILILMR